MYRYRRKMALMFAVVLFVVGSGILSTTLEASDLCATCSQLDRIVERYRQDVKQAEVRLAGTKRVSRETAIAGAKAIDDLKAGIARDQLELRGIRSTRVINSDAGSQVGKPNYDSKTSARVRELKERLDYQRRQIKSIEAQLLKPPRYLASDQQLLEQAQSVLSEGLIRLSECNEVLCSFKKGPSVKEDILLKQLKGDLKGMKKRLEAMSKRFDASNMSGSVGAYIKDREIEFRVLSRVGKLAYVWQLDRDSARKYLARHIKWLGSAIAIYEVDRFEINDRTYKYYHKGAKLWTTQAERITRIYDNCVFPELKAFGEAILNREKATSKGYKIWVNNLNLTNAQRKALTADKKVLEDEAKSYDALADRKRKAVYACEKQIKLITSKNVFELRKQKVPVANVRLSAVSRDGGIQIEKGLKWSIYDFRRDRSLRHNPIVATSKKAVLRLKLRANNWNGNIGRSTGTYVALVEFQGETSVVLINVTEGQKEASYVAKIRATAKLSARATLKKGGKAISKGQITWLVSSSKTGKTVARAEGFKPQIDLLPGTYSLFLIYKLNGDEVYASKSVTIKLGADVSQTVNLNAGFVNLSAAVKGSSKPYQKSLVWSVDGRDQDNKNGPTARFLLPAGQQTANAHIPNYDESILGINNSRKVTIVAGQDVNAVVELDRGLVRFEADWKGGSTPVEAIEDTIFKWYVYDVGSPGFAKDEVQGLKFGSSISSYPRELDSGRYFVQLVYRDRNTAKKRVVATKAFEIRPLETTRVIVAVPEFR